MINLEDNKIWSDSLGCYVVKYDVVVDYIKQASAPGQLDEVLRLVRDSTDELNSILKDIKL